MSKQPALTLKYISDSDGTGELIAEVRHLGFSGHGSAWFGFNELTAFTKSLRAQFPFPPETSLILQGGYWKKDVSEIDQVHLGLHFYPKGKLGVIGCRVHLQSSFSNTSGYLLDVEILTSYEEIRNFSYAFENIILERAETAGLVSTTEPT